MLLGYAGRMLEVDLSREKIEEKSYSEDLLRQYVGGRSLATRILWSRLGNRWQEIDPLGPENVFLALTGPLTGYYPGAKILISGKSPQSNGILGSAVSGEFAIELKCAGYDGVVVEGAAKNPVYLFIKDDSVEIRDASDVWGADGKQTVRVLTKKTRDELSKRWPSKGLWKEPGILYIGPAGENRVRIAAVFQKWSHAAGYGGYGGVMGSKNLKAIVAKGTKAMPPVADQAKVNDLIEEVCKDSFADDDMRRWGTGYGGYSYGADMSSIPVRNWREEWHNERSFGVDKFEERVWVKRYWGDYGCPTTCLKLAVLREGPYKGAITDTPDYELQAYLGPNLGIFTPEENVYLVAKVDDLGLDGISAGNVMGFAAELYQRGVLTSEELDGIDLEWGDAKAFALLAERIALRKGIGDILAEGTHRAAVKISEMKDADIMKYSVQSKGIAIGAHGIRSGLDYVSDLSYSCSVQGGDHTSTAGLPLDGELWKSELSMMVADSGVVCAFNVFDIEIIWPFLKAVTGWDITRGEWYGSIALKTVQIQRAALLLGGPDLNWDPRIHDENPQRFYEPLPSGPKAGEKTDRDKFCQRKKEFYTAMGWDKDGIPTSETLERLGLQDVNEALRKLRKR